jgi:ComF family protein
MVNKWIIYLQKWRPRGICALCHSPAQPDLDLCPLCEDSLTPNRPACPGCGEPMPGNDRLCGRCLSNPPLHDTLQVVYQYRQPLSHLVQQLKFNNRISHARLLGTLLARHINSRSLTLPDAIVPMPLHVSRQRERGFNQSLEIARHVSRLTGIPVHADSCIRQRATATQSLLDFAQRRKNLKGAFRVSAGPLPGHVAILDDVLTTGNTCRELTRTLKQAGVRIVDVWIIAKAVLEKAG